MKTQINLPTKGTSYIVNANITDLIEIGWYFEEDDYEGYHAEIRVDDSGNTEYAIVNSEKLINKIWEGSDYTPTGDDEKTIEDLAFLAEKGKLWGVKEID